jgi:hypothetical protein
MLLLSAEALTSFYFSFVIVLVGGGVVGGGVGGGVGFGGANQRGAFRSTSGGGCGTAGR